MSLLHAHVCQIRLKAFACQKNSRAELDAQRLRVFFAGVDEELPLAVGVLGPLWARVLGDGRTQRGAGGCVFGVDADQVFLNVLAPLAGRLGFDLARQHAQHRTRAALHARHDRLSGG